MQNFIVLGIIPGINYQTTFAFWMIVAASFFGLLVIVHFLPKRRTVSRWLAARRIAHTIDHFELIAL